MLGCNDYNLTYVHGPVSFEAALLDTLIWIAENQDDHVLLGGAEELTDTHFRITDSAHYWKKGDIENFRLLDYKSSGTIAGEGAAFFVLSGKPAPENCTMVKGVKTIYKPENKEEMEREIMHLLASAGMQKNNIDLVLLGYNGDSRYDGIYKDLEETVFSENSTGIFKHLCGEHYLASSFGFWLADKILKERKVPPIVLRRELQSEDLRNILIYNQYNLIHHSLILVSSC
jgi:hypothetical protein